MRSRRSTSSCVGLPIQRSDHGPLIISTKNSKSSTVWPLKLESFPSRLPEFPLIMEDSWSSSFPHKFASSNTHILDKLSTYQNQLTTASNQSCDVNLRNQLDLLLQSKEEYWRQRSKLIPISEGDRNTKFFHSHVKHKTKINNILELKDSTGNLISYEDNIINHCKTYFEDLFNPHHSPGTNHTPTSYPSLQHITTTLTPQQISYLNAPFTQDEVKDALFQMPHYKSPGPDGFPAEFYQKNWDIFESDVIKRIGHLEESLNEDNIIVVMVFPLTTMLKSKYFPHSTPLNPPNKTNASWTWRSIQSGLSCIKDAMVWTIGNGLNIRIWKDNGLLNHHHANLSSYYNPMPIPIIQF
ncbi:hypothetical protein LIER_43886 [Lithospermum erythrorhizon]|uniref:Reverse transcriptase n=1 Tax=Lithospermum erythrorhizon TaxID=34254 RepID=A0AAV3R6R8_LITER